MDGLMVGILSILIDIFVWCVKLAVSIVAVGSVTAAVVTFYAVVVAIAVALSAFFGRTPLTVRGVFETTRHQNPGQTSSLHRAACHTPRNRSLRGTSDCPC